MATATSPSIRKLGTIDCDMVETTPLVVRDRLYRFEYVRRNYPHNHTGRSYFRFVDVETRQVTPAFAEEHHLGSAYVEGDSVFVFGDVGTWGSDKLQVFWSDDLKEVVVAACPLSAGLGDLQHLRMQGRRPLRDGV